MIRVLPSAGVFRRSLVLCFLAGFALSLFPLATKAQLPVIRFVKDPDPAPDFQVKDIDGKEVSLSAYKGKVILLNFWATWCGPCRAEIPGLVDLQNKYKDQLQIIGMAVDEDDDTELRDVIKSESINYPVAITPGKIRMEYGGIAALPTLFVLNTDGKVVQKHVGLYDPALYETEVRALLALPINARIETFNDTGEIFLKHADRATMLPGVNTEGLTPEQRAVVLKKFNAEACSCGCKYTLAQCRIYDPACAVSKARTAGIVKEVSAGGEPPKPATPAQPEAPASPSVPTAPESAPDPSAPPVPQSPPTTTQR
jgi:thiol-disulfide isomerase/thioredoxin